MEVTQYNNAESKKEDDEPTLMTLKRDKEAQNSGSEVKLYLVMTIM